MRACAHTRTLLQQLLLNNYTVHLCILMIILWVEPTFCTFRKRTDRFSGYTRASNPYSTTYTVLRAIYSLRPIVIGAHSVRPIEEA